MVEIEFEIKKRLKNKGKILDVLEIFKLINGALFRLVCVRRSLGGNEGDHAQTMS